MAHNNFNMSLSLPTTPALFVLLAMAIYTGVTVNFLGKRFGDWRFSWSYILGWVALLMTFFAGLYMYMSAVDFITYYDVEIQGNLLNNSWRIKKICHFAEIFFYLQYFSMLLLLLGIITLMSVLHSNFCLVFAGIFYMCAYRMHECRRVAGPR